MQKENHDDWRTASQKVTGLSMRWNNAMRQDWPTEMLSLRPAESWKPESPGKIRTCWADRCQFPPMPAEWPFPIGYETSGLALHSKPKSPENMQNSQPERASMRGALVLTELPVAFQKFTHGTLTDTFIIPNHSSHFPINRLAVRSNKTRLRQSVQLQRTWPRH